MHAECQATSGFSLILTRWKKNRKVGSDWLKYVEWIMGRKQKYSCVTQYLTTAFVPAANVLCGLSEKNLHFYT